MNSKKSKPIYGKSEGAKSGNLSSGTIGQKNIKSSGQEYAKSGELFEHNRQNSRSNRVKSAGINSLPRTIFKLSIVGAIAYLGILNTNIGKNFTDRVFQTTGELQKSVDKTRSELDPKQISEKRQKKMDDKFQDAWHRSGGESDRQQ